MKLADVGPSVTTRLEEVMHRKVERGQIAQTTSRKILLLYGSMMRAAVREGWVAQAPVVELPPEPEREYVWIRTAEGMRKLIAAAREEDYPGLPELYATALYTGLRSGELSALEWTDIDFVTRLITVSKSNDRHTKNSRVRRVPFSTALGTMLEAWRGRCHSRRWVFPNLAGKRMSKTARAKREIFARCLKEAGLAEMTFHALRHTFASHFMLAGGDIYRLQRILGHSSIKMTQRYAHLSPEAFRGDHDRLPDIL